MTREPRCRALVGAALFLAVLLMPASPVSAHAIVRETSPGVDQTVEASPARVVMRFNEPVEIAFGAIRVFDTNGRRVDEGRAEHVGGADGVGVRLRSGLRDGTYTVTWRVVSADGHPIHEAFVFHVGAPGARRQGIASELLSGSTGAGRLEGALAGVARWLTFSALIVLIGAWGFRVLVSRTADGEFGQRWRTVVAASLVGAAVGTAGMYVMQGAIAGDLPLGEVSSWDVLREVARTRFGKVALARLAILAVGAAALVAAWRGGRGRWSLVGGSVVAGALAVTPGLAGHAGSTSPEVANIASDGIHVAAAAVWIGGLVVLLVAAFPAARLAGAGGLGGDLVSVVARFSDVAVGAVAVLVMSGVFRSWVEVRAWRAITESYGLVLIGKVAVFVPILALGLVNNRLLKPKVQQAEPSGRRRPLEVVRRFVFVEVSLAVAVLGLTALLVNLPPARVAAGVEGPFISDVRLGEYRLNVLVDPDEVGENEVHLTATTTAGAAAPVQEMRVLFRMPEEGIGPLVGEGVEVAPGHFVVQGRQLSVAGRWVLEIVARTGRFDEEWATATIRVN